MQGVALPLPLAVALVGGAAFALMVPVPAAVGWGLPLVTGMAWVSAWRRWGRLTTAALACGFALAGVALGADARADALEPSLRRVLSGVIAGMSMDEGVLAPHDPVPTRLELLEDAAPAAGGATLRARTRAVRVDGRWTPAEGGVIVSVRGETAAAARAEWTAGRSLTVPLTWGRATRYLNDGLGDAERVLALDGTTLFGSAKSALVVENVSRGSPLAEVAARARRHVRQRVARWVAPHDTTTAGIVTAILIGDRTGMPPEVRDRLQAAGTYHVIAISGGNIAILVGLTLGALALAGVSRRSAALATLAVLAAYVAVVTTEPSVWRATLMAAVYLAARLLDHRVSPWQGIAVAAMLALAAAPLDVRAVGFLLTFGATVALLEVVHVVDAASSLPSVLRWPAACVLASMAVEVVLLPVFVTAFGRVTVAGIVLNLLAVPLMTLVQVAGMAVALAPGPDAPLHGAGWLAHVAAAGIVESARLVDLAPWLVRRVPPPAAGLVALYYAGLVAAWRGRGRWRVGGAAVWGLAAVLIVSGVRLGAASSAPVLRLTVFDVGQGEAMLLEAPLGPRVLIDAGGQPFGEGADIGGRVLVPALWARGVRAIDLFVMTHADPDHLDGGRAVLEAMRPPVVWEGVPVPDHAGRADFLVAAGRTGAAVESRFLGAELSLGLARVRVLHPEAPDWRRPEVRNDDSLVLEVVYGNVALLLTGDVSADVERELLPRLTPARHRVLKVAHHGSRFSTGQALVDGWRPHVALVSAGRGNTFGHPAPDVLSRLEAAGVAIYRTDRDGQITLETDGETVRVRTYVDD
jgi:competence protein ComEC